ncbi:MAG: hypothetical protein DMG79_01145 [Acidobacteria bacterium]|nr:MAG: hypothetical protein DMG79_01145 [Acidobacteriota bacterium]
MWTRTVNGKVLHFYLAGINNQNFLMRDKETGTWWQQITGKAISGPMKGAALDLVLSDELTFGEWKSEFSNGEVLAGVPKYIKEYDSNWEPEVAKLKSRDVVVGLQIAGPGRAYPWDALVKQSPVLDRVNGTPLLVAVGPDSKSFRVFVSRIDGKDAEFFLKGEPQAEAPAVAKTDPPAASKDDPPSATKSASSGDVKAKADDAKTGKPVAPSAAPKPWILLDTATASEWNFQGCAISGPSQGKCLDRIPALKDYWFDWRNYHPDTTIYKR